MSHNSNIKLMKSKPTLSDEEIRSQMDFDKLLRLHQQLPSKPLSASKWVTYTAYITSILLLSSAIIYFAWPEKTVNASVNQPTENQIATTQDSLMDKPEVTTREAQPIPQQQQPTTKTTTAPLVQPVLEKENKESLIVPLFKEAEPINGYPDLYAYFERELTYPAEALNTNVEGVVSVSFAISQTGQPIDIRITNSLGEAFDKECIRVIEKMPPWRAATINDAPTTTRLSIPLTFRVTNKNQ